MTDRIHALTVTLEHDQRDDDCKPLIQAIQMMRGVLAVQPLVADPTFNTAEIRARSELHALLFALSKPITRTGGLAAATKALKSLIDDA